jgi:exodeoxyribonuclease VII small subunit
MGGEKTSGVSPDNLSHDERLSYEQARAELATVVERLEAGGSSLEESLALWERGERLAEICQHWLDGARGRLKAARKARESSPTS